MIARSGLAALVLLAPISSVGEEIDIRSSAFPNYKELYWCVASQEILVDEPDFAFNLEDSLDEPDFSDYSLIDQSSIDYIPTELPSTNFDDAEARKAVFWSDQLTLRSVRITLSRTLEDALQGFGEFALPTHREVRTQASKQQLALEAAFAAARNLTDRSEALEEMLGCNIELLSQERASSASMIAEVLATIDFIEAVLERLGRLNDVQSQLEMADSELRATNDPQRLNVLQEDVQSLEREMQALIDALAERLAYSDFEVDTALGMGFPEEGNLAFEAPDEPIIWGPDGSENIAGGVGFSDGIALPQLFPWPPPRASASAVIRNAFFRGSLGEEPTLGEVSDLLVGAMSEAGYHQLSYLGAPGGFALVTSIEQTRADGTPLEDRARWAARIERVKSFSLSDILQAIFTAPEGYYRVIAIIVSDTPFSERGGEALLSTVETWISEGVNVLPVALESLPFTSAHNVTALVYEFRKRADTDAPSVNLSAPLPVPQHLAHTSLARGFR